MGLVLGMFLYFILLNFLDVSFFEFFSLNFSWIQNFNWIKINSNFLSDLAGFEGVLIGVAIPISLQVVTWTADRYLDNEIAQFFTSELLYKLQFILLLPNIIVAILFRFLTVENEIVLSLIFIWLIINILIFYKFVRLVEEYATNTDRLLLRKLKEIVEKILKK